MREGRARAFVRYSRDYVGQETKAKADRLGVHAHTCELAWQRRAEKTVSRSSVWRIDW